MKTIVLTTLSLLLLASPSIGLADDSHGGVVNVRKVSICHATHSVKNPFVLITVGAPAERAHAAHQGGEDVLFHENLNVQSGPADAETCASSDPTDPGSTGVEVQTQ